MSFCARKPKILLMRSDYLPSAVKLLKQHFEVECWDAEKNGNPPKNILLELIRGKFGLLLTSFEPVDEEVIAAGVECWDAEKNGSLPKNKLLELIRGKFGLLVTPFESADKEVIAAGAPTLRVVSTVSVGLDHLDLDALKRHNVRLGYTPGVNTESTAELTVALLLATSRRLFEASAGVKNGTWLACPPSYQWLQGQGLHDSTVGIIGYGQIGHSVALKLKAFSPRQILYFSRKEKPNGTAIGAILTDLDTLLRSSDFVVVTIAATPETRGIISRSKIALMKKNAIFVNTGRGVLVDQDALVEALEQRNILGAGLDVMTPEPLPLDHPLQKLDNCVLVPHVGAATSKALTDLFHFAANNIIAVHKGTPMPAEYIL